MAGKPALIPLGVTALRAPAALAGMSEAKPARGPAARSAAREAIRWMALRWMASEVLRGMATETVVTRMYRVGGRGASRPLLPHHVIALVRCDVSEPF